MSNTRNARECLDTLLTGLENDVMRGEGTVVTDVEAMRAEIAELIERRMDASVARGERPATEGTLKDRSVGVVELLRRWAGIGQGDIRSAGVPRVRMAFSGESERRREGGSEPGGGSGNAGAGKEDEDA